MKILRQEMRELGIDSKHLAIKLGVSEKTISNWMTGKFFPNMTNMTKLRQLGFSEKARVSPSYEEK